MAIVVGLRSSATDADVRLLAILMGARLLLKIEADLLLVETFVKIFTKFHWELHEVLEAFGLRIDCPLTFATFPLVLTAFPAFRSPSRS